jgi:hypothetical protein
VRVWPDGDWVEPARVELEEDHAAEVRIAMRRGARIGGVTTDAEGRPSIATLTVTWGGPSKGEARGSSGDDGTFRFHVPPDAVDVVVRADHGMAPRGFSVPGIPFAVARGVRPGTGDLVLRMTSGDVLRGTVVGPQGEPVPSGWVMLLSEPDDPRVRPSLLDEVQRPYGGIGDGKFELRNAPAGKRRVVAIPEGDEFAPSDVVAVDVPGDGVKIVVPRSVEFAGVLEAPRGTTFFATWRGSAADGTPIWRSATTAADGTFTLRVPPRGPGMLYVRSAHDDRYAVVPALHVEGPSPRAIPLQKGLSVSGSVVGLEPGEAAGSTIRLEGDLVQSSAPLSADATFVVRGLPPGDYRVTVEVPSNFSFATSTPPQVVQAGTSGVVVRDAIRRVQKRR